MRGLFRAHNPAAVVGARFEVVSASLIGPLPGGWHDIEVRRSSRPTSRAASPSTGDSAEAGAGPGRWWRRVARAATRAAVGVAAVAGAGSAMTSWYFARRLLTPDQERADNVRILALDETTVTFAITPDTVCPGRYGVWLNGGQGHLRVGDVVGIDETAGEVVRRLMGIDVGPAKPGLARWNGFYYGQSPDLAVGLPVEEHCLAGPLGPLPAWVVRSPTEPSISDATGSNTARGQRWAVLLHGRGGIRQECIRALPVLHRLGITSLVPMYRNDLGAPPSPDGRYTLGLSEWADAEAAVNFALEQGARSVVLVGWSMGGAIGLQLLSRSRVADAVEAVVLDSPVIDWGDVVAHHARLNRIPTPLAGLTRALMRARWAHRLVGVHERVDVAETDWAARANELHHPMLIIHSRQDELVPVGPSQALARARPDLVRLELWQDAAHTKEWNTDPQRWERVITEFLTAQANPARRGAD